MVIDVPSSAVNLFPATADRDDRDAPAPVRGGLVISAAGSAFEDLPIEEVYAPLYAAIERVHARRLKGDGPTAASDGCSS